MYCPSCSRHAAETQVGERDDDRPELVGLPAGGAAVRAAHHGGDHHAACLHCQVAATSGLIMYPLSVSRYLFKIKID